MENPYWDAVKDHLEDSIFSYSGGSQVKRWDMNGRKFDILLEREDLTDLYAWSIPDPAAIAFIAVHGHADGMVDPMAGTGYWAYVLGQAGVDVVCYDLDPGENNTWHPGGKLWVPVDQMRAAKSVAKHPDRTLFLSWPPYGLDAGEDAIRHYAGRKIIFLGEHGGCTGGEGMFDLLHEEWRAVAEHPLVQWEGLHDSITVYERVVEVGTSCQSGGV